MSNLDLKTFINDSSAQSLGRFGEFLFAKFCSSKNLPYSSKHKGGVDFSFDNENLLIDIKAVRHIKTPCRARFRRHSIERQLPDVLYGYIIFWNSSIELRVEKNDVKFGNYDCFFDNDFVNSAWESFDKKSVKFLDKSHVENTNFLKRELSVWLEEFLGVKARVIQRKASASLGSRKGGWGADNFYTKPPHKHKIVVLLCVANGVVQYIHSYPTSEHMNIDVRPKPVGTNRKEILCYDVTKLSDRYKFKDIDDFKANVKERFNL